MKTHSFCSPIVSRGDDYGELLGWNKVFQTGYLALIKFPSRLLAHQSPLVSRESDFVSERQGSIF